MKIKRADIKFIIGKLKKTSFPGATSNGTKSQGREGNLSNHQLKVIFVIQTEGL